MTDWKCWRDPTHPVEVRPVLGWPQCTTCGAAPAYHERPDYLPDDFTLGLYVPSPTQMRLLIAERSGVVGLPIEHGLLLHFEGWVHGAAQYERLSTRDQWAAGVMHAAGRLVTDYPTRAFLVIADTTRVQQIGTYLVKQDQIDVTDEAALDTWLEAS